MNRFCYEGDSLMIRVTTGSSILLVALLLPVVCYGQLPSSGCDSRKSALEDCTFLTHGEPVPQQVFTSRMSPLDGREVEASTSEPTKNNEPNSGRTAIATVPRPKDSFH